MLSIALISLSVLIIVLSALRTRLVYELSGMSLLMFGSTRPGLYLYSFLVLPGTIIHELSHWIVAEILQVRTGEITILPNLQGEGDRERLGSVATAKSDPFRGFLIGIAPFFTGIGILLILGNLLSTGLATEYKWWWLALIIYGIMVIGNSMLISREDRRTWPFMLILLAIISFLIVKYFPTFFRDHEASFIYILEPLNRVLGVTAALNLVMIGGSYGIRRLIEKLTKRRITHK